jgi:pimeloyl-ACP methyl ester carboxylesterase
MINSLNPRRFLTGPLHLRWLPILIAVPALVQLSLPPVTAAARGHDARPTIVLVHGAWAGPSSWDQVVRDLHDDGYQTATPIHQSRDHRESTWTCTYRIKLPS